jgi:four helix bundle protein
MEKEFHQSFTELIVWQEGRKLKKQIADLAKTFPGIEKYKLTDQIIRSSRSVNSNIAEGHGRYTYKDQLHFCIQSRGSLSETHNHLIDAVDEGYISEEELQRQLLQLKKVEQLLNGYISFLRKKMQ